MATGPNDLQREAQLAFKRGKAADSMREHSDLAQAVVAEAAAQVGAQINRVDDASS